MAHSITRIKEKLVNTPHLINEQSFEAIMSYVNERNAGNVHIAPKMEDGDDEDPSYGEGDYLYNDESRTAILYINGPLTNKKTGMEMFCGGTSYEGLKEDFTEAVQLGAKTIVFAASSGGGEATAMLDTARYMRKLADDNGVQIISYVEDVAASACYGLICISDEIIAQEDASIGSIGVLVRLMNDSRKIEMEGYERTFITAGSEKQPFAADGSFRKEFLADIQYKVDKLYESFTAHVAQYRNMSVEAVKATQARTFLAEDAVELGLADRVMDAESFYDYLAESAQRKLVGEKQPMFKFKKEAQAAAKAAVAEEGMQQATMNAEMAEQLVEMQAVFEAQSVELAAHVAELASVKEAFEAMQASLQEKEEMLLQAKEVISQMEAASVADKKEMKLKERTAQLAECMDEKAAAINAAALEGVDDAAFAVVLQGYQAQRAALEQSDLFSRQSAVVEEEPAAPPAVVDAATEATLAVMRARGLIKD